MSGLQLADIPATCAALKMDAADFAVLTPQHQSALRFYAAHKDDMDAGAELLDVTRLPLHACYHIIATEGADVFACELQNDPPEDTNTKTVEIEAEQLLARRIGAARGIVPDWAQHLILSADIGAHVIHWEVCAWDSNLRASCLIDQGQQQTNLNEGGEFKMTDDQRVRQVMIAKAIDNALTALWQTMDTKSYAKLTGEILNIALSGVDCGGTAEKMAWYQIILKFCEKHPRCIPLKGASPWSRSTADRAFGRNWICEVTNNPGHRHDCNVDEYKLRLAAAYVQAIRDKDGNALQTPAMLESGARILHKEAPLAYIRQQVAEKYVQNTEEDAPAAKAVTAGWRRDGNKPNHWWDTAWMQYALAEILPMRLKRGERKVQYGIVGKVMGS